MNNIHPKFADKLLSAKDVYCDYETVSISKEEGGFLTQLITENSYSTTIEVGCALGLSSLYICDAISKFPNHSHTILDPAQQSLYNNIGLKNLEANGYDFFTFIEEYSEIALPKLLSEGKKYDFGFIDGWHTFDHTLIDFFYLNRMVKVGGMIVFDDADWPSVTKLLRYLGQYPSYEVILPKFSKNKNNSVTIKQQLFKMMSFGAKIIPEKQRKELFSERIVKNQYKRVKLPSVVALKKISEDNRDWKWYKEF